MIEEQKRNLNVVWIKNHLNRKVRVKASGSVYIGRILDVDDFGNLLLEPEGKFGDTVRIMQRGIDLIDPFVEEEKSK